MVATNHITIKVVIFNFSQLNRWITFCRYLEFFSFTYFQNKQNGRRTRRDT